jgi:glucosamine--fructose-6-phosphate aminotransferase (isomerizing)
VTATGEAAGTEADALLWREIEAQPRVLAGVAARRGELARLGRRLWGDRRPPLAVLVARGTSDHAAVYARYLIEVGLEVPASLAAPSVYTMYGARPRLAGAVVLACSQSGASPDLVEVVRAARVAGATTVALVNRTQSPLADVAEHVVDVGAGEEVSVAATKSFTAELATLAALILPASTGRAAAEGAEALERVAEAAAAAVAQADAVAAWARRRQGWRTMYVVGRGFAFPAALEIALKLKEMASAVAEGYSAADVRHGPIALRGPDMPIWLVGGRGPALADLAALAVEARAGGSPTLALTDAAELADAADEAFLHPPLPEVLSPIPAAILGQMAAFHLARARGLHPGAPAGIGKVTRTR